MERCTGKRMRVCQGEGEKPKEFFSFTFHLYCSKNYKKPSATFTGTEGGYFSVTLLELKSIPSLPFCPCCFPFLSPQLSGFREYSNAKSVLG